MFIYTNPNPIDKKVGDCVIRAIAIATETTWERAYMDLCMEGLEMLHTQEEEDHRQIVTLWEDIQVEVTTMVLMMVAVHTEMVAAHTEVHMMDMI